MTDSTRPTQPTPEALAEHERRAAVAALAEAFADYPVWTYASPRPSTRARFLRRFYAGALKRGMRHGSVWVTRSGGRVPRAPSRGGEIGEAASGGGKVGDAALFSGRIGDAADRGGEIAGVAIVYGPDDWPAPRHSLAFEALPFIIGGPRLAVRGHVLDRATERPHPSEPHFFIHTLGVHPGAQRSGAGSALVREVVAAADERCVVTHLTTSRSENVTYYRSFGFRVTGVEYVDAQVPIWAMDRAPR